MPRREAALYLQDILSSIIKIEEYTKNLSRENFLQDDRTIDAVVRNLEIIGEAANNIPKELSDKYPGIPWEKMVSMRNKVLHEYFGIDEDILWKTIKEDIQELKEKLSKLPRT